jgi:hypothetical protein
MTNYYDPTANELILARIGRRLMDISATAPMKGLKDAEIGRYNRMASFGDALTRVGTVFGPRDLSNLLLTAQVTVEEAQEFFKIGQES